MTLETHSSGYTQVYRSVTDLLGVQFHTRSLLLPFRTLFFPPQSSESSFCQKKDGSSRPPVSKGSGAGPRPLLCFSHGAQPPANPFSFIKAAPTCLHSVCHWSFIRTDAVTWEPEWHGGKRRGEQTLCPLLSKS